jgi:hypothetical protein
MRIQHRTGKVSKPATKQQKVYAAESTRAIKSICYSQAKDTQNTAKDFYCTRCKTVKDLSELRGIVRGKYICTSCLGVSYEG